jgi:hypothetical protein
VAPQAGHKDAAVGSERFTVNLLGNLFKQGALNEFSGQKLPGEMKILDLRTRTSLKGSKIFIDENGSRSNRTLAAGVSATPALGKIGFNSECKESVCPESFDIFATSPFDLIAPSLTPPDLNNSVALFRRLMASAGSLPNRRVVNSVDGRLIKELYCGTGQNSFVPGPWSRQLVRGPDDSDFDGLPDDYENKLNPNANTDSTQLNPATGKSWIEDYIDTLAAESEINPNFVAPACN